MPKPMIITAGAELRGVACVESSWTFVPQRQGPERQSGSAGGGGASVLGVDRDEDGRWEGDPSR